MGGTALPPLPWFLKSVYKQKPCSFCRWLALVLVLVLAPVAASPMPFHSLVCQSWDQPQIPSDLKCALH